MDWGVEDVVAAVVLLGAGAIGIGLAWRWFAGWRRGVAVLVVVLAVVLVRAELATGLFR